MKRLLSIVFTTIATVWAAPSLAIHDLDPAKLHLLSANAVIVDAANGRQLFGKAANEVTPIASLTKLMTAMVVLDAKLPLEELLDVDMEDFDFLKGSGSRLRMGATLSRDEMLRLALMASENRAASALARHYPGGNSAFIAAMNVKARGLGMKRTRFEDSTGLSPRNVSTASDLAQMVQAAATYPLIREYSTTMAHHVSVDPSGRTLGYNNSNALVRNGAWDIQLQKTGYIREAGRCVVLLATIASRPMVIVLLDSIGKYTRLTDAQRVKHWLETGETMPVAAKPLIVRVAGKTTAKRVNGTFPPKIASSSKTRGG